MLIVVVVIAILAAITIVSYNGIQRSAQLSALKSEVSNAAKAVEAVNITSGSYPTTLPVSIPVSTNNQLSLSEEPNGYCVNIHAKNDLSVQWRYSSNGGLQEGLCPGQVIAGSEQGLSPNLVTNQNFTSGWGLIMQNSTGRTLGTRAGAAGDPHPTRRVLTLQNTGSGTTSWAVITSTAINRAEIISGQAFQRGFWVRKVGNHPGGISISGVLDGNGTNWTLGNGPWITLTDEWQFVTHTSNSSQNAPSTNVLYTALNTNAFPTPGWTLEFQGFELRRVQ